MAPTTCEGEEMTSPPTIAELPADQRPRERLARHGVTGLSDAELLAILLGSGLRGVNVVDLAARLLASYGGVGGLRQADTAALAAEPGVGPAKAARVVAALALAARAEVSVDDRAVVARSSDVARLATPHLAGARRERVVLVVCGAGNRVLATVVVSDGGAHHASFPVREVLAEVLRRDGVAFALAHNHPGGDPAPSTADRVVTRSLRDAAAGVGLRFLDHVVLAGSAWASAIDPT